MYHGRVRDNYGNRAEHASQIAWQFSTACIMKTHICYHWTPHGYQSFYRCTLGPKVSVIEAPSVGLHMLAWASVAIHDIATNPIKCIQSSSATCKSNTCSMASSLLAVLEISPTISEYCSSPTSPILSSDNVYRMRFSSGFDPHRTTARRLACFRSPILLVITWETIYP